MRDNPSDGGVDCNCSRNFVSVLSSSTSPEMDIIINRQTNTHESRTSVEQQEAIALNAEAEHTCRQVFRKRKQLNKQFAIARGTFASGCDCRRSGSVRRTVRKQSCHKEYQGWQCSQGETAFIQEWRCHEDWRVFLQTEEDKSAKHESTN